MTDLPSFDDALLQPLLDRVSDGIAVAAPGPWRVLYASRTLAGWLGKSADELRGTLLADVFIPPFHVELLQQADRVHESAVSFAAMTGHLQSTGAGMGAVEVRLCRVVVAGMPLLGVVIRPAAGPSAPARRDPLTGLADREFLLQRLAALLRGERSRDKQFAVLFIDLDNFKQVNDAHGHLIGDRVLREVARRLSGCLRDGDHVVRFGGDEFVVLVEGVTGPSEIDPIVRRIEAALARPIALPQREFTLSLSIGVAQAAPEHHTPEELLRDADRAMYAAKRARTDASSEPAAT